MTRVILNGCNGKMGQAITQLSQNTENIRIVAGFDVSNTLQNPFPVFTNPADCQVEADAIIDFSRPEALSKVVEYAREKKLPLVVATTGLEEQHHAMLKKLSNEVPVLVSANMSIGVNLLLDLVQKAAKVLEENFDIEIIEKHHNAKVDAPSGTALLIADAINTVLKKEKDYIYERKSTRQQRDKSEMGLHSVRGGTIVGEHTVIFAGFNEIIELKHTAHSREIFANGALNAAQFLSGCKPGLYSMKDFIG